MDYPKKLGVFGGTFNPIHNSHLYLIEQYHKHLQLDNILLIPTYAPPHKAAKNLAAATDRLAMCRLAAEKYSYVEVSSYEIDQKGLSYTYLTLAHLEKEYPSTVLYLLMGADMFLTIEQWRCPEEIYRRAVLCTVPREPEEYASLIAHSQHLKTLGARCEVLSVPARPLSSTQIRESIRNGTSAEQELPTAVWQYIQTHHLYQGEDT